MYDQYDRITPDHDRDVESDRRCDPFAELAKLGISMSEAELVGQSAEKPTSHLCVHTVEYPSVRDGEVFRMEVYRDVDTPHYCFFVLYRRTRDGQGRTVVTNQFFTNDPAYAQRHRWLIDGKSSQASDDVQGARDAIMARLQQL